MVNGLIWIFWKEVELLLMGKCLVFLVKCMKILSGWFKYCGIRNWLNSLFFLGCTRFLLISEVERYFYD